MSGSLELARADVALYDALASSSLLRRARPGAEIIYVGKRPGHHALTQTQIEQLIVDRAGQGERVVRLKGGDPFVFGRGERLPSSRGSARPSPRRHTRGSLSPTVVSRATFSSLLATIADALKELRPRTGHSSRAKRCAISHPC